MQKILSESFPGRWNSKCKGPEAEWVSKDQQGGQNAWNLRGGQVRPSARYNLGFGIEVSWDYSCGKVEKYFWFQN